MDDTKSRQESKPIPERRAAPRYPVCFPVHLMPLGEELERLGVSQQVSRTGGLFMTQYRLREGDPVRVRLFVSDDTGHPRTTTARVVWSQRRDQANSYWLYDAAIRFDTPIDDTEPQVRQLVEKQRRWMGG